MPSRGEPATEFGTVLSVTGMSVEAARQSFEAMPLTSYCWPGRTTPVS